MSGESTTGYLICAEHNYYSPWSIELCFHCSRRSRAQSYDTLQLVYQQSEHSEQDGDTNGHDAGASGSETVIPNDPSE